MRIILVLALLTILAAEDGRECLMAMDAMEHTHFNSLRKCQRTIARMDQAHMQEYHEWQQDIARIEKLRVEEFNRFVNATETMHARIADRPSRTQVAIAFIMGFLVARLLA